MLRVDCRDQKAQSEQPLRHQLYQRPHGATDVLSLTLQDRPFGSWRPESGWNSGWRDLRYHKGIVSGREVNWLIDEFCWKCLPAIDLAHVDLARCEQRPE